MASRADSKVVRDPVHGYVKVPSELEGITQLPQVRRLRSVSQTANVRAAYPSLNGPRYEHALGTMHLAMKAWESAWENLQPRAGETKSMAQLRFQEAVHGEIRNCPREEIDDFTFQFQANDGRQDVRFRDEFKRIVGNVVGLCGLLHDLGHPPFSHLLENLYLTHSYEIFGGDVATQYKEYAKSVGGGRPAQFHEYTSKQLLESMIENYPEAFGGVSVLLLRRVFSARSGDDWADCLHGIIDGQIDVDRLDYVMRDSLRAGVESWSIDRDRLLESIEIRAGANEKWIIGLNTRAVSSVESLLEQRVQYYRWVIHHPAALVADTALSRAFDALLSEPWDFASKGTTMSDSPDFVGRWNHPASSGAPRSFEVDDTRVIELLRTKRNYHLTMKAHQQSSMSFDLYMRIGVDLSKQYTAAWSTYGDFLQVLQSMSDSLLELGREEVFTEEQPPQNIGKLGPSLVQLDEHEQLISVVREIMQGANLRAKSSNASGKARTGETLIEDHLNLSAPAVDGVEGRWIIAARQKFSAVTEMGIHLWGKDQLADPIPFRKLSPVYDGLVSAQNKRPPIWAFFAPLSLYDEPPAQIAVSTVFIDKLTDFAHTVNRKG